MHIHAYAASLLSLAMSILLIPIPIKILFAYRGKNGAVTLSINHAYVYNARHCERSEAIQDLRKNWIASSLRSSQRQRKRINMQKNAYRDSPRRSVKQVLIWNRYQ